MRFALLLLIGLGLVGCSGGDPAMSKAAGVWSGHFEIDSVGGKDDPKLIEAELFRGTLQLSLTSSKFKLEMASRHQQFTLAGKWSAAKNRVTMTTSTYAFKNPTEEEQKTFALDIIAPDQIRATFGHPIVFDETPDKRRLTGLKTSMGKLMGHFEFERPIPR